MLLFSEINMRLDNQSVAIFNTDFGSRQDIAARFHCSSCVLHLVTIHFICFRIIRFHCVCFAFEYYTDRLLQPPIYLVISRRWLHITFGL